MALPCLNCPRKKRGGLPLVHQVLVYPATHFSFTTQSHQDNGEGYFLTHESIRWFANHYLRSESDAENVMASPLLAEDLSDLPSALVITAEYDPLHDEGEAYARRLKEAGVHVELTRYDGMIHGFFWMAGVMDKGKEAIEQVAHSLRSAFERTQTI